MMMMGTYPIDSRPPIGDIFRPPVLVLEVVCMLPDVKTEDGRIEVRQVLVAGCLHNQNSVAWA